MISYSFYIIASKLTELLDGKKFKINFIRFIFIFSYWGIYLKAGVRRGALFLICMLFFWILSKNINRKKCIGYMTLVFIFLLLLGYIRNKVQSVDISYIYINSLGEFILPQWISYYYIYNPKPLLLGKTYLYTFLYLFPKALLPNKPEDLGIMFWKEAGTNTALAFNPVAEGIINFGNLSIIFVPIIIFVLIFFIRKFKKRQLLYFVFCGAALNFMRGAMANFIFECLFVFICIKIMNMTIIDKFKGEIYEKQL
ncbi:hypothetical protein [Clostridium tyrobutyricum]|uniref:hypothetical protein n=1 Tax=Clostridium tyrobutyricum TaxID=1519 RepID=UPI001C3871EF|nr:hypothetical protein [Clostridium tyrobutyricum]